MKFKVFIYLIILSFPSFSIAKTVEKTLATIDGEIITLLDLKEARQRIKKGFFKDSYLLSLFKGTTLQAKDFTLLNFLIYKKILDLTCQEKNITIDNSQITSELLRRQKQRGLSQKRFSRFLVLNNFTSTTYKKFLKQTLQRNFLIQREVIEKIQITSSDLNEYAIKTENKPLFSSHTYDLSYVVFPLTPEGLQKIRESAQQLSKTPSLFNKWTNEGRTRSFDKLTSSAMHSKLKQEISKLSVEQISNIVTLPSGYHIFKVLSKTPVILNKDKKRQQLLSQKLFKSLTINKLRAWLEERKKISFIHISSS